MEVFISTIMVWAPDFAPNNWIFCQGQIMQIAQNPSLFSLLQTTYGGDGITTFGLPNFASRVLVGVGQAPGLDPYKLGETGGVKRVTLPAASLPAHTHDGTGLTVIQTVTTASATQPVATDSSILGAPNVLDSGSGGSIAVNAFAPASATPTVPFKYPASGSTGSTGTGAEFDARSPYIAMNWIMALDGIYPARG
jgi:microcystin-dependent protein